MSVERALMSSSSLVLLGGPECENRFAVVLSWSGGPVRLLDTLSRASVAELPVSALVRQGSRGLAARDGDAVEQAPLWADVHRGVNDAFSLDRRAQAGRRLWQFRALLTCASHGNDSHTSKR